MLSSRARLAPVTLGEHRNRRIGPGILRRTTADSNGIAGGEQRLANLREASGDSLGEQCHSRFYLLCRARSVNTCDIPSGISQSSSGQMANRKWATGGTLAGRATDHAIAVDISPYHQESEGARGPKRC